MDGSAHSDTSADAVAAVPCAGFIVARRGVPWQHRFVSLKQATFTGCAIKLQNIVTASEPLKTFIE
jgi:hypothetical protein